LLLENFILSYFYKYWYLYRNISAISYRISISYRNRKRDVEASLWL